MLDKCIGKLIGERTRAPKSPLLAELCFVNDAVITTTTRQDITKAIMELEQVTTECGLTISFPKTKLLVAGTGITEAKMAPLSNVSSVIESVPSFRYLQGQLLRVGVVTLDVDDKIARASKLLELLESLCSRTALYQDRQRR